MELLKLRNKGRFILWNVTLKQKDQLFTFVDFVVGDGRNIRFWDDLWCATQHLATLYRNLYVISSKKDVVVADCWIDSSQTWDLGLRRRLFAREVRSYIALAQLLTNWVVNRTKDSLRWRFEASGIFSTKSTFLKLTIGA